MRHPLDFIENIQQKPEPTRKLIATALVIFFILIIIGIWITTFSLPESSQQETPSAQPSPFTLLWNFTKESFK
ncbi:hypothetical protein A3B05_00870 [Candidatus Giovannonibacteria bacterium RIFCSPLOWO2_01_FULL_43_160]|uniref:Uncharacterized protein n=1 Tax=Candidatus Giovannonibacteria bacterium RIFCSPLOWO2_12_FULL_43_26 TaxID=1798363 RepID=A0A1F5XYF2_9BACT|nr:MAG: hypothetical protein A2652_00170 [Candidatus Giovannonibacteria bacterium RIFCSPHIGHO2_01_FULL_43_140]OGF70546.1 MAG: hypothetical protein A3C76_00580 [Candidatus Giovannonibacteria bacterium RIFCSPHIGHO2_02_FULL_44_51]OGF72287.1 MAG: hypothetical protein A3E35_01870 [Candidatus Giovannonibacteria bacterium RIFCSPHIGHO2_12_FULL_44_22]OGF76566.1 MAG: hypothetical protein A3B05_00870 [Candidatus Giovannonibacteria bacterium RIFCSPLOWO2_01_FULL_43_160]OGF86165.1 MAG: hypothetical protein A